MIEYLTNLDAIGVARCRFIALPLAIDGADGSPVRAIALVADSKIGKSKGASAAPSEPQNRVAPASRRSTVGQSSDALLAGSAQPGYGVKAPPRPTRPRRGRLGLPHGVGVVDLGAGVRVMLLRLRDEPLGVLNHMLSPPAVSLIASARLIASSAARICTGQFQPIADP